MFDLDWLVGPLDALTGGHGKLAAALLIVAAAAAILAWMAKD